MLCVTLAAWCAAPAAFALDTGDIVVTSIKGDVRFTVNGAARALKAGGVLETPSSIRTGRDGAVELKQGATTVSVGPDTQLDFPAIEKRGGPIDRIVQPRGNAFYSIGKREGRKLRVETPYLVGVIKGTQFNVATQEESTTISLFEGRLEVHATDESDVVDLNAGEIATRKRGDKSITVMKMDGKIPSTPPRPTSGNGGGNPENAPRGTTDSVVAGGVRANPAGDTTISAGVGNGAAGATVDVRAGASGLDADVGIVAGETGAKISAAVNLDDGVNANAAVGVTTPAAGVDAGVNVGVSGAGILADVNAGVGVAPLGTDVSTGTSVDVNASGVNVSNNTSVDVGSVAGVDANAAVNVGASNLGADLGTSTTVDAGPVAGNVGATTSVDVGTGGVAAAVDTGANVALGNTSVVDTSTSVNANLGTTPAVGVETGTTVAGVETGVAAAVNASTGTVDLGLNVAGTNVNVGVDLGGNSSTTTTTTTTTPAPVTTPIDTVTDLLGGLVRRKK